MNRKTVLLIAFCSLLGVALGFGLGRLQQPGPDGWNSDEWMEHFSQARISKLPIKKREELFRQAARRSEGFLALLALLQVPYGWGGGPDDVDATSKISIIRIVGRHFPSATVDHVLATAASLDDDVAVRNAATLTLRGHLLSGCGEAMDVLARHVRKEDDQDVLALKQEMLTWFAAPVDGTTGVGD